MELINQLARKSIAKLLTVWTIILGLYDTAATMFFVRAFGPEIEANPVMAYVLNNWGTDYFVGIKLFVLPFLALFLYHVAVSSRYTARENKTGMIGVWVVSAFYMILSIWHAISFCWAALMI